MISEMAHDWWMFLVRGLAAIIFGALALIWPSQAWLALVVLFGVFAVIDGIVNVIAGLNFQRYFDRWWAILVEGVVGILVGVFTFIWPNIVSNVLFYFVAAWAVMTGILEIVAAIRIQPFILGEWSMILGGILSILFGILLFVYPAAGLVGLVWAIGLYAILYGVLQIVFSSRLHGLLNVFNSGDLPVM